MWSTYFGHDKTSFCCFPQNLAWCGCFKGKGVCATPLELHLFQEFRKLSLSTWLYKNTSVWSMIVHFWNYIHFCNILYCQRLRNSWNFKHFNNCRLVPKCIFEVRLDQRFGMPKNHSNISIGRFSMAYLRYYKNSWVVTNEFNSCLPSLNCWNPCLSILPPTQMSTEERFLTMILINVL